MLLSLLHVVVIFFVVISFLLVFVVVIVSLLLLLMLFSRAAVQATAVVSGVSVKKKAPKVEMEFAGDILLKFKHSPEVVDNGEGVRGLILGLQILNFAPCLVSMQRITTNQLLKDSKMRGSLQSLI